MKKNKFLQNPIFICAFTLMLYLVCIPIMNLGDDKIGMIPMRAILGGSFALIMYMVAGKGFFRSKINMNIFTIFATIMFLSISLCLLIFSYQESTKVIKSGWESEVFISLILMLCVGIMEEFMCRAIFLNGFRKMFAKNKKGLYGAVLLSSLIFGVLHYSYYHLFLHMHNGDSVVAFLFVVLKILITTGVGVFFATIYLKTNSILYCVILHGLNDFILDICDIWIFLYRSSSVLANQKQDLFQLIVKCILYVVAICTIIVYVVKTLPKINPEENIMWKSDDKDNEVLEAVS